MRNSIPPLTRCGGTSGRRSPSRTRAIRSSLANVNSSISSLNYDGEDDDFYAETRVNRPDLAYEGGESITYFINKDTAAIGFKIVPHNLNQAGGGWLDAIRGNARCDGTQGRQGDWAVRACEVIKGLERAPRP